jgi:transposase InsO family protein
MSLTGAQRELLRDIWRERPSISAFQLRERAAREDVALSIKAAEGFLEEQKGSKEARAGEKLAPRVVYRGQTAAEDQNERWQADLGFMNFGKKKKGPVPEKAASTNVPCFLLVVDVFSRHASAEALPGKSAPVVLAAFKRICNLELDDDDFAKLTVTTDRGGEFGGAFRAWLEEKGAIWRVRTAGAKNDIAVCDTAMAMIKKEIKRLRDSAKTRNWQQFLQRATKEYNQSATKTLHGTPEGLVEGGPESKVQRFLLQQDNAKKIEHNDKLTSLREFDLVDRSTTQKGVTGNRFQPPVIPRGAFQDRVTISKFSGARLLDSFPAPGVVKDTRGGAHALKLIKAIGPARSAAVPFARRRAAATRKGRVLPEGFEVTAPITVDYF